MEKRIIEELEKLLNNDEQYSEEIIKVIKQPRIAKALNKVFEGKTKITQDDLLKLTTNEKVLELLDLFASENNIEIIESTNETMIEFSSCSGYYSELKKIPVYTREEEVAIFNRYINSNDDSEKNQLFNEIVIHNLKLVLKYAYSYCKKIKFNTTIVTLDDMVQEGNIGLMTAIDKFDPTKGVKFSTYASYWIMQYIARFVMVSDTHFKKSVHTAELELKLIREEDEYRMEHEKELIYDEKTLNELSEKYGCSPERILIARNKIFVSSLDSPLLPEKAEEGKLIDFIPDQDTPVEEEVVKKINDEKLKKELKQIMTDNLKPRAIDILSRRYGLFDMKKQTLEEVAAKYNISKEAVRQSSNTYLKKLRKPMQKAGFHK